MLWTLWPCHTSCIWRAHGRSKDADGNVRDSLGKHLSHWFLFLALRKSFCRFHSVSGLTAPKLFCCCGFDSCIATQTKVPQEFRPGWHDTALEAVNVAYNGVPPPVFATTNLEVMFLLIAVQDVLASVGVVSDIKARTLS